MTRKIIHIDMDAFFAAVEQRDFPELRGKPVIVGGDSEKRGVVSTCSYEARKFGVRSAMPSATAKRLCPQGIFVKPRFEAYRQVSHEIRALMQAVTPLVEPLSLDEAYLDVTGSTLEQGSATRIAELLRRQIFDATGLTASAGVSYNKMLAKIASDMNKPNGLTVILPEDAPAFVAQLPIEKFHGIGKVTAERMHALGIRTGLDLREAPLSLLTQHFGKIGAFYHSIARGDDPREVVAHRERKSVGSETTFAEDLHSAGEILQALFLRSTEALDDLKKHQLQARTLTIKIKYADFTQITRSHSITGSYSEKTAQTHIARLLEGVALSQGVRLAGVSYSNLHTPRQSRQLPLPHV